MDVVDENADRAAQKVGVSAATADEVHRLPRSRRGTDPLAAAIFGVLKDLDVADRRLVLAELDSVDRMVGSVRERLALAALGRCRGELRAVPSKGRYEEWRLGLRERGVPSASFVAGTFGGWAKALDAAGLEPTADLRALQFRGRRKLASDDEILAGLRECAAETGQPLLFRAYRAWARERERSVGEDLPLLPTSLGSLINRFGSYANALARAGLHASIQGPRLRYRDHAEIGLAAIRAAHVATGPGDLTCTAFCEWRAMELARLEANGELPAIPSVNSIRRAHGSWPGVLVAAGLKTPERAAQECRGRGSRITPAVITQSLLLAIDDLGADMKCEEYFEWRKRKVLEPDAPRLASLGVITRNDGAWATAKQNALATRQRPCDPLVDDSDTVTGRVAA
ncbi:MAG: hypothetical protein ACR2KV_02525 [Solirubrobacteraceae bacterium]